eukprot:gene761-25_t
MKRVRNASIKVIDFGNATFGDEHHSDIINTRQYRAPEVIMGCGWDHKSDMWSLGCIIAELYVGELLFLTHDNLELLALIEKIIGIIPRELVDEACHWVKKDWFRPDGRLDWPYRAQGTKSRQRVRDAKPLHQLVDQTHKELFFFVRRLLTIDPVK